MVKMSRRHYQKRYTNLKGPLSGLDYSDAFFARAKFRAAAKNEKYRSARCEKLTEGDIS